MELWILLIQQQQVAIQQAMLQQQMATAAGIARQTQAQALINEPESPNYSALGAIQQRGGLQ